MKELSEAFPVIDRGNSGNETQAVGCLEAAGFMVASQHSWIDGSGGVHLGVSKDGKCLLLHKVVRLLLSSPCQDLK